MLPVQGWAPWDKAKKKFAEKKERDAKRTAAFAEGTSLGNKHLDRLVAANDWVRDKMDDFRDFRSGVKEKIADKYHGSKFESGVNKDEGLVQRRWKRYRGYGEVRWKLGQG